MQHRFAKLLLGALFALACVGNAFAASSAPPNEQSVPLVRGILDGPVPNDPSSLHIAAAEMFQLGFAEDARLLESYSERSAFLHLLNRPYTPAATVREALQQEANAKVSLDQLRTDFMHEGYSMQVDTMIDREGPGRMLADLGRRADGVEILPLQPGLWGEFDPRVTHSVGHSIQDADLFFLRMKIRNQTAESGSFALDVPIGGRVPMSCKFDNVAAGGTRQVYCMAVVAEPGAVMADGKPINFDNAQGKARMIETLMTMLDGHPITAVGTYRFMPNNYLYSVTNETSLVPVTPEARFGDAWDIAKHSIANAGCEKLGTCIDVFKGYVTNGGVWCMVITAAFMIFTLYGRWFGNGEPYVDVGRFFSWCFWIYFMLVALGGFFFYVDPPHGTSGMYSGLLSEIAAYILSTPWNAFMSSLKEAVPYGALRDLSTHDFEWQWFFIFVNLAYLGLMTFSRRLRR